MKSVLNFIQNTAIGGLLVILPIYLSVLLVVRAAAGLGALLAPITAVLPEGIRSTNVAAVLVVLACFFTGLIVYILPRTRVHVVDVPLPTAIRCIT